VVRVAGCRDRSLELIGFRVSASAPVAATGEDRTLVPDRLATSLGHMLVVYLIAERLPTARQQPEPGKYANDELEPRRADRVRFGPRSDP
jgi:hypothetical protein